MLDSWTQNLLFPQPSQPSAPLLAVQKLAHSVGEGTLKKQILADINLTIYPGEIVILTGASGSGKTTLLKLIGALRSAQAGSLNVFGQELKGTSAATRTQIRRKIGFIFQDHNLLPFMTTLQNVRTVRQLKAASNRQIDRSHAEAILTKVGLGGYLNAYPKNLSGGQKQRVAVARAFVNEPALLLADEPTASLESQIGREVMLMMQRLAKEQRCAVLVVTHDTRILDIADRIIHLEDGRIFQEAIDQAPRVFAALARAVPDRSILDWATSHGSAPFRTPAIALAAEPALLEGGQTDKDAAGNPILHPLVSDNTPLFFSKLPKNGAQATTDLGLQPPPAQKPPTVSVVQPSTSQPVISPPVSPSPAIAPEQAPVQPQSRPIAPASVSSPPVILPQQTASKTYMIACIDDNPTILYTMQSFLEDDLFSVLLIQDPEQALAEILEHRPSVIVLDIAMPKLDGYQIAALIRQNQEFSNTPIIFIADDAKTFNSKRAKALGVTAYLKKPFSQADLIGDIFPHLT